ncbi:hypothetical protein [Streptomyces gardneri]|uniref:hypothetical protein n=1 Tax=Streptomyces gardneri TaxID=66892 RepID=UPI0037CE186F
MVVRNDWQSRSLAMAAVLFTSVAGESEGFEAAVEFPGRRVENPVEIPKDQLGKAAEARLGGARFVLDERNAGPISCAKYGREVPVGGGGPTPMITGVTREPAA